MLHIGDVGGIDLSSSVWLQLAPFVVITMDAEQTARDLSEKGFLDLVPQIPQDEVVYLHSWGVAAAMEDMSAKFPKLRALHSGSIPLPAVFPESNPDGNGGIPTSLQHIRLEAPVVDGGGWRPLTTFLARRVFSGNRIDSSTLDRSPRMHLEAEEDIRSMVGKFRITHA